MTELKTLKDWMERWKMDINIDPSLQDLKQEAIKWVKAFDTLDFLSDEIEEFLDSGYDEYSSTPFRGTKAWVIKFFNLTEEDLK